MRMWRENLAFFANIYCRYDYWNSDFFFVLANLEEKFRDGR